MEECSDDDDSDGGNSNDDQRHADTEDFDEMFARASEFYKRPGGDRFLGPELPRWFFVFLLRFCALQIAIKRTQASISAAIHERRKRLMAVAVQMGLDELD